jgi:nucleoside-diphosphate-sugar epimerase
LIAVTGASGYLGALILDRLRNDGPEAVAFARRPREGERRYVLGEPADLDGVDTVVHAAYDLGARGRDVYEVNVRGSLSLLDALAAQGGRMVLISSLAAYEGAASLYGQAKRALEREVLAGGGAVVRPGLVFGEARRGLFGQLVSALQGRSIVPMIGAGWQRLFVTHEERLCALVSEIVTRRFDSAAPVFAAHEVPTTLRAIVSQIVAASGKRPRIVPLPGSLAYGALRAIEVAGVRSPFRSDSLKSLMHPIPLDQVASLARGPIEFPALTPELWSFSGPPARSSPAGGHTGSAPAPDRR